MKKRLTQLFGESPKMLLLCSCPRCTHQFCTGTSSIVYKYKHFKLSTFVSTNICQNCINVLVAPISFAQAHLRISIFIYQLLYVHCRNICQNCIKPLRRRSEGRSKCPLQPERAMDLPDATKKSQGFP